MPSKQIRKKSKSHLSFQSNQSYVENNLQSGCEHFLGHLVRHVGQRVVLFNNMGDGVKCRAIIIDLVIKLMAMVGGKDTTTTSFNKQGRSESKGLLRKKAIKQASAHIEKHSWCIILSKSSVK